MGGDIKSILIVAGQGKAFRQAMATSSVGEGAGRV